MVPRFGCCVVVCATLVFSLTLVVVVSPVAVSVVFLFLCHRVCNSCFISGCDRCVVLCCNARLLFVLCFCCFSLYICVCCCVVITVTIVKRHVSVAFSVVVVIPVAVLTATFLLLFFLDMIVVVL